MASLVRIQTFGSFSVLAYDDYDMLAISKDILTAALTGLEQQRIKLDEQLAAVRTLLGVQPKRRGGPPKNQAASASEPGMPARKRRRFSAATRRKMADAQRKRWAAIRKTAT